MKMGKCFIIKVKLKIFLVNNSLLLNKSYLKIFGIDDGLIVDHPASLDSLKDLVNP